MLTVLVMAASPLTVQKRKSGKRFTLEFSGIWTINEQSRAGWVLEALHQQCSGMMFGTAGQIKSRGPRKIHIINWSAQAD